jgi:hypothetical protein
MRSSVQADYLFAVTWRHIYYELGGLDLNERSTENKQMTLQNWLISVTAACINRVELPPVEEIHYALQKASPPLWCYLEQALAQLLPIQRLIILMAQTFHWSEVRIAAYLQAEGDRIPSHQVKQQLEEAYRDLETVLPEDIRQIYLEHLTDSALPHRCAWRNPAEDAFSLDPQEAIFE